MTVQNDNVRYFYKPMMCGDKWDYVSSDDSNEILDLFDRYCINLNWDEKPTIKVNSPNIYFNITHFAQFENIIFDGSNMFGRFQNGEDTYHDMREYPNKLCSIDTHPGTSNDLFTL
jgi:hypothetical protein